MSIPQEEAVRQFREYDFDNDEEFREGLKEILGLVEGKEEAEKEEIVGRAKVFYFSRKANVSITWEDVKRDDDIDAPADNADETPLTFAQLSELIQSGQTHLIPNNKEIPEGTNVCPFLNCCIYPDPFQGFTAESIHFKDDTQETLGEVDDPFGIKASQWASPQVTSPVPPATPPA